ncbi:MAG: hypothetical protein H8E66_18915 [Planctomycetes bacterium]|nr:hypothetical protein [Planctomycetota bacterium]
MTKKAVVPRVNKSRHEFEALPEFDKAMRHLITVPKETVDKKMAAEQAKKKRKK